VSRLQDMGVPGYLLSETLACVVAQRLLPSLCPRCKEPVEIPDAARAHLPADLRDSKFSHALGCPYCRGLGYRGRVPVVDVFYVDEGARRMIASGASLLELRKYNQEHYSPGLPRRALELAAAGRIDLATALTVSDDVALEG
jgi:type II secretory ATPase GspE/PulE/Tfp pilus assembly ATPase PilB-like protein